MASGRSSAERRRFGVALKAFPVCLGFVVVSVASTTSDSVVEAASFDVTSTVDAVDANPGNGQCATADGDCTLRAAIQESNALPGRDTIVLPAGTYALDVVGAAEDAGASGDLDITGPVTVMGAGAASTVVDGITADRVIEVFETAGDVTLTGVTIRNGASEEAGAGVFTWSPGVLRLDAAAVRDNVSTGDGGGVHAALGTVRLVNGAVVEHNVGRNGGGIYSAGEPSVAGMPSRVDVTDSTIRDNTALEGGGGGVWADGQGNVTVTRATLSGNTSAGNGAAIAAVSQTALTIVDSAFDGNGAHGDGGAVYVATERPVLIDRTSFVDNDAGVAVEGEADGSGGGLMAGGSSAVTVRNSTFSGNDAASDGGGLAIDNNGFVNVTDTVVDGNVAGGGGGGVENAGMTVTFTRLTVTDNVAHLDGGGIESQGSGSFTVVDSTVSGNTAENGGGYANNSDGSTRIHRTTFWNNRAVIGGNDDTGLGGGIYSLGDASADYENVTISANQAHVRGGGFYVDADAPVHLTNVTIAANSAPAASGLGGEEVIVSFPVQPSTGVLMANSIVAGNTGGPNCNFPIGSLGGNLQGDGSCYFMGPRDRTVADPLLDAVADNGGLTMTMAAQPESLAIDGGVAPCAPTDQRGVARPINIACDSGAFEYEGPFPPADTIAPDTQYVSGPVQDTENTSIFTFRGEDGHPQDAHATPDDILLFECRLIESDITEIPEIPDPTEPLDPELAFVGCQSPWQVPILEEGSFRFEVRAIDRAGNTDPSPATVDINIDVDVVPPDTFFLETPTAPGGTTSRTSAVFTIGAMDNTTPAQFMEVECRVDSNDPAAWLECTNPFVVTNLTPGTHTVQARAADGWDNIDPTPATFTWTVEPGTTCESGNITLFAAGDATIQEALPEDNFQFETELLVQSAAPGDDMRTLVEFALPAGVPAGCALERATLRLAGEGEAGRTLHAAATLDDWSEDQVTWLDQPDTAPDVAVTSSGSGYRNWDVTARVAEALADGEAVPGWMISDADEEDPVGVTQSFIASEAIVEPPVPPQLVLRFQETPGFAPPAPPPPPPAVAVDVTCGQVVTASITVANDLTCLGEGLVIGASDIVVDLGGHTIRSGLVIEPGEEDGLLAGIRNSGHTNVVIRNGTVEHFGYGLRLMAGATWNVVEDMTFVGNINAGVELLDADDGRHGNTVRSSTFRLNGDAVSVVGGSEGSKILDNTFLGNLGRAFYLFEASGHVIAGNTISGETGDPLLDSDGGFYLESSSGNWILDNVLSDTGDAAFVVTAGSHDNVILANTSYRSSDAALSIDGSDGNIVSGNTMHLAGGAAIGLSAAHGNIVGSIDVDRDGDDDVDLFAGADGATRTLVETLVAELEAAVPPRQPTALGNDVRFNPGGIELAGSDGNLVVGNDARETRADGIGIEAGFLNTVSGNLASATRGSGIAVDGDALDAAGQPANGNVIHANVTNDNLGDGISIAGAGQLITENDAFRNLGWGITAATPNVNAGNRAAGNGEPPQCQGVVCSTTAPAPPAHVPDTTMPDTTITSAPTGGTTMDRVVIEFTATDDRAPATALRYECRLDAPPDPEPEPPEPGEPVSFPDADNWEECTSPVTYAFVLAGTHTFEVRAIDPSDNKEYPGATHTWTVVPGMPTTDDTRPPSTTLWSAPPDPSTSTTAELSFRGSDNVTPGPFLAYECALDGGPFATCSSPTVHTDLALGSHTVQVRAVDLNGNADPTPATYSWTIVAPPPDTTPPDTSIDVAPDPTTVETSAELAFSSDEDGVTFHCQLNGTSIDATGAVVDNDVTCTSPIRLSDLAVGTYTFTVAADDGSNVDPSPASFTWTVTPAPVPTALSCGAVVTSSVLLTADLVDCAGDGIVIGADAITIDLGGHTVDGVGLGGGVRNDGFDAVTITNGVVNEFDVGVLLRPGTSANIVAEVTATMNELAGIELWNADQDGVGNTVRRNTVSGNGGGIALLDGTDAAHVHDNVVTGSSGEGLRVAHASGNRIVRNEIAGTSDRGVVMESATNNVVLENQVFGAADSALVLDLGSNDNRIEANSVGESESGIVVAVSHRNVLVGNTVSGSSDSAIALESANDNVLESNDVRFNSGGIELTASSRNTIRSNDTSFSSGPGIEIGDGSLSNRIVENVSTGNDATGISVGATAPPGSGNIIERNVTNSNAADGLAVEGLGNIITGNSAISNSGWGIYSSLPTPSGMNIDGGGNRALGNVELEQCFGIRCDGGAPLVVDLVSPDTSITGAPVTGTMLRSATFTFTGNDNATAVGFECRLHHLDGGEPAPAFTSCTSPASYHDLTLLDGDETYRFEVRAVDYFGNTDATPATHTWTIVAPPAGVAPETTIDSGPDPTTASTSATFTFGSNEPDVTFQCSLDGAAFTPCPPGGVLTGLSRTSHTLDVRAVDTEALVDETPASFTWVITAAPVPSTVACGQTLSQSTLVLNDLTDCLGNGLVIGAPAVTIDLGGRTLDGTGLGAGVLNPGFASVTITNGVVQEFDAGIRLDGASVSNVVANVRAQLNQETGVELLGGADGARIRTNTVIESSAGIVLVGGVSGAAVHDNTVTDSAGDGVRIEGSDANRVERNSITRSSGAAVALVDADDNVVVANTSTLDVAGIIIGETGLAANDNVIERNVITGASSAGIEVVESTGNRLLANSATEGGSTGIELVGSTGTIVEDNDVRFNASGISLEASPDNRIARNDASSSNGAGISMEAGSIGNDVIDNRASGNSGEGIYVGDSAPPGQGNVIDGNTASNNSGGGIFVNAAQHVIAGNIVDLNDGWGIFAVPGNVDGGGNVAAGNAEPLQCTGVTCTIGLAPGAPNTELVLTPTDPSNSSRATFTFTGSDDTTATVDLGFQCRLDGVDELDWVDCDNPWEITDLSPGEHRFEVRAVDQSEVVDPSPAVFEWEYVPLAGGVAPNTIISLAPPQSTPVLEGVFTFTSNEPDVTFECRLDTGPWEPCEFFYEYAFEEFEVGPHTFAVRATDFEGNTDPTPAVHAWTITGVVTTITDGPAYIAPEDVGEPAEGGETEDRTATFTFQANIPDATFMCSINLGPFAACTSGVTYTGLQVGERVFMVYAVDPEEEQFQIDPTEYGWTILPSVDVTPPTVNSASGVTDVNGAARFLFSASDNVTSSTGLLFECTLALGAVEVFAGECASPLVLPNPDAPDALAPGTYTFTVVATDAADNVSAPGTAVFTYNGDLVEPLAPTVVAGARQLGAGTATFSFTANDPFAVFECSSVPVGEPHGFEPCTSPADASAELPGVQQFAVRAIDLAGNVGDTAFVAWTLVDVPVVTITAMPADATTDPTATFAFAVEQAFAPATPPAETWCSLDGAAATPCTSPVAYTDVAGGTHTFEVHATNHGLESAVAAHTWTSAVPPAIPPVVTLQPPGIADPSLATTATFTFAADQPEASFLCVLEPVESVPTPCSSPVTYDGLVPGVFPGTEHTFEVYAVNGTLQSDVVSFEWNVTLPPPDTTPPESTVSASPPATTTATSASFTFSSNEVGSTFECALDAAAWAVCTSPATFGGMLAGTHTFSVRAIDPTGNVESTPTTITWAVQAPPPDCSLVLNLTATADAWIDQGSPSSNKGTDSVLKVMSKSGSSNLRALVSFALPAAPPAGCVVDAATLRLYASSNRSGRTLRAERLGGSWSERSVTWSNQPVGTGDVATTTSGSGWRTWNVRQQVEAMFVDGNFGFLVRDNVEGQDHEQQFASRERSSNRPNLVVTFAAAPAPDTTPPETTMTAAPPASTDSTSATFAFTSSETPSTFECRRGTEAWAPCASGLTLVGLDRATHTFEVRAVDGAGNIDASPAAHTWTIVDDTAPPDTSITQSPLASTSNATATFAFSSTESGSTFECALDGDAFSACATPTELSGLAVGPHTFAVRASDAAGNVDASAATFSWTVTTFVDCGAPVTIGASMDSWIDSGSPSTNKGSDSVLKVFSKSGGNNRALARFELPAAPAGCAVQSAALRLNAVSARTGRTLRAERVTGTWTESGVTWANQPATDTASGVTTASGTGWREWAVGPSVRTTYGAGATHVSFVVRDASENNDHEQQFRSRESGGNAPHLVVTFAAA